MKCVTSVIRLVTASAAALYPIRLTLRLLRIELYTFHFSIRGSGDFEAQMMLNRKSGDTALLDKKSITAWMV